MTDPIRRSADESRGARIERLAPRSGGGFGQARSVSRFASRVAAVPDEAEFDDREELTDVDLDALELATEQLNELRTIVSELRAQIDVLEFSIREHVEIELARDLEIGRLEDELTAEKDRTAALSIELFHTRRRAEDLDRRWNELAATYEECAERLVDAGAQLEAIHQQSGYRFVMRGVRFVKRFPALYRATRRVGRLFCGRRRSQSEQMVPS